MVFFQLRMLLCSQNQIKEVGVSIQIKFNVIPRLLFPSYGNQSNVKKCLLPAQIYLHITLSEAHVVKLRCRFMMFCHLNSYS